MPGVRRFLKPCYRRCLITMEMIFQGKIGFGWRILDSKMQDHSSSSGHPPLKGLILAGGESTRMGWDKGMMDYHGLPQRDWLAQLIQPYVAEVFLSARPGQITYATTPILEDRYTALGPFGAILSAFQYDPTSAWLVIACDFPLLDDAAIQKLILDRKATSIATSYLDPHTLMPEPWISILEPSIYPLLQDYHHRGRSSLRGLLVDYNSHVIRPEDTDVLLNANTPDEAESLREKLDSKI